MKQDDIMKMVKALDRTNNASPRLAHSFGMEKAVEIGIQYNLAWSLRECMRASQYFQSRAIASSPLPHTKTANSKQQTQ